MFWNVYLGSLISYVGKDFLEFIWEECVLCYGMCIRKLNFLLKKGLSGSDLGGVYCVPKHIFQKLNVSFHKVLFGRYCCIPKKGF